MKVQQIQRSLNDSILLPASFYWIVQMGLLVVLVHLFQFDIYIANNMNETYTKLTNLAGMTSKNVHKTYC